MESHYHVQQPMSTVKASATDATITGGTKRRADQMRQARARNRDYYIQSQRARGEAEQQLSAPRGVRLDSFCLRRNDVEGPTNNNPLADDDEAFSPSLFPKEQVGDLSSSSPAALSVRFLSRFRLSEGGMGAETVSNATGLMDHLDLTLGNVKLPRLHSKATLLALKKRMVADGDASHHDGFFSFTNSALSSVDNDSFMHDHNLIGGGNYTGGTSSAPSNSVNLLALHACLDSIAETATMPKSRLKKGNRGVTGLPPITSSLGLTGEEDEEPLGFLLEDLDTTLQSLFSGVEEDIKVPQRGVAPPPRPVATPADIKSISPRLTGGDPVTVSAIANIFGNFITTIDVYEAIYWQITETAATLLMSDLQHNDLGDQRFIEGEGPVNLLATVGQWVGLATVTCLHALDPRHFEIEERKSSAKSFTSAGPSATFNHRQLSSCLIGLFTLLLRFSVSDFSPISQLLSASAAPMSLLFEGSPQSPFGSTVPPQPSPNASVYSRSLQEMCTEACGLLLSSPVFSQFVGLVVSVDNFGGTGGGGYFQRQDTESLGDFMIIESLFLKSFTEAARQRDRGVPAQHIPYGSSGHLFSTPASHSNFLLRDSQENAALLLCIICASAAASNATILASMELDPLLGHTYSTTSRSKILVVSPRIASIAFSVFNEFLTQAVDDVSREIRLQQGGASNNVFPNGHRGTTQSGNPVPRYYDPQTGCYYYPPSSALCQEAGGAPTESGGGGGPTSGGFQVDCNVSLDSVMNALKGLGDLIGILYCLETLVGGQSTGGTDDTQSGSQAYSSDSNRFFHQNQQSYGQARSVSEEFSVATERLQQVKDRAAATEGDGNKAIVRCYSALRSEVIARLTSNIQGDGGEAGYNYFRPLLQKVPTIRSSGCMGSLSSPTTPHSPHTALPLIGADDMLSTAFMLAEGVISFYGADPRLAIMIPSDVMQYFYDHHSILFRVSSTFSPYERSLSRPREEDDADLRTLQTSPHDDYPLGGVYKATSPYSFAPPPSLQSPLNNEGNGKSPTRVNNITPLLVRCRDALANLYCRAPSLVFQHWELFSSSILPFLSNHMDTFTRHHVLFILATLFQDPNHSSNVMTLIEQQEFQNVISAVFDDSRQQDSDFNLISSPAAINDDEETDDANAGGGDESNRQNANTTRAGIQTPLTDSESALLDIILGVLMGGVGGKDDGTGGGLEAALALTDLDM